MNLTILAYGIYFAVMAFIIMRVGWLFYKHGQVFIDQLFPDDLPYGQWINKLLLKGYYLFNLGYVAMSISSWTQVATLQTLLETLARNIGFIVIALALMHYLNILWLNLYSRFKQKQRNNITLNPRNHGNK